MIKPYAHPEGDHRHIEIQRLNNIIIIISVIWKVLDGSFIMCGWEQTRQFYSRSEDKQQREGKVLKSKMDFISKLIRTRKQKAISERIARGRANMRGDRTKLWV